MIYITKPDGVSVSGTATYSTSKNDIFLRGYISSAGSIIITYEGETFSSVDSDVLINGDLTFVFPNPNVFPDGIELSDGANTFGLVFNDHCNTPSSATANVVLSSEVLNVPEPPLGISVRREANAVNIVFPHVDSDVVFYTLYASTISGGGAEGYSQINLEPIDPAKYGSRSEVVENVGTVVNDISAEDVDPLIAEVSLTQKVNTVDVSNTTVGEIEVPESVSRMRVSSVISQVYLRTEISFRHFRGGTEDTFPPTILNGSFASLPASSPLFYIITSTKVVDGVEVESAYSTEVSGKPVQIQASNTSIPVVSRDDLTREMIRSIYLAQPDISVQAGSVVRDIIIDPIVSEMERSRFLLDYSYRSSSFLGLLQIDDPLNEGRSLTVENSQYKTALQSALFLQDASQVQALIDASFEKLASNFGVSRRESSQARGEVVFSTKTPPTFSFNIPSGTVVESGTVIFQTTTNVSIPLESASQFYNPVTKSYSVTAPVVAVDGGLIGNLTSGQINQGAPLGLSVTNPSPTFGGLDRETNLELTTRALGALNSIDGGTRGGYERLSRAVAGVQDSFVVDASSIYMKRDQGLGGAVDIWIKGESLSQVTDIFAPSFQSSFGSRFVPVGGLGAYRFRSLEATVDKPIYEMINRSFYNPDTTLRIQYGLRKSNGEYFDLTGYTVEDYRTIALDISIVQPSYTITEVLLGDWRSDSTSEMFLSRQPVRSVSSVVWEDGSSVENYKVNTNNDPLLLGGSSKDFVSITLSNEDKNKIKTVSEESHTIVGFYEERLDKLGADPLSLVVKSLTGKIYSNPYTSSPDYTIDDDGVGQISIKRTSASNISDGEVILISYEYLENIVVTYTTNLVVQTAQTILDEQKNLGADVVVKEIREVPLSITATVILEAGYSSAEVNSLLRYRLTSFILSESVGGAVRPSEVIREINATEGVSHVSLPLTRMSFEEGAFIVREEVLISLGGYREITSLSNSRVKVWVVDTRLLNTPQDKGGEGARIFKRNKSTGVETSLALLDDVQRVVSSNWLSNTASFIGNAGLAGVEDSSSKIVVGLEIGDDPSAYTFEVDYVVEDKDEVISEARLNNFSAFSVGELSFTFEEVQ
tara:strand:- start:204 stop:3515 length:3312 start_codon:yes stop_codon:yes gene_type:complete